VTRPDEMCSKKHEIVTRSSTLVTFQITRFVLSRVMSLNERLLTDEIDTTVFGVSRNFVFQFRCIQTDRD